MLGFDWMKRCYMPYKHIMLAIDQDDVSHEAIEEAIELAKLFQARLRIVHVVDQAILADIQEPAIHKEVEILEKSSLHFLEEIAKNARKSDIETETKLIKVTKRKQHVAFEVVAAAKEWPADLLIIGAYSRQGVHRLLLGHVAESIIRITDIPVLILHTHG